MRLIFILLTIGAVLSADEIAERQKRWDNMDWEERQWRLKHGSVTNNVDYFTTHYRSLWTGSDEIVSFYQEGYGTPWLTVHEQYLTYNYFPGNTLMVSTNRELPRIVISTGVVPKILTNGSTYTVSFQCPEGHVMNGMSTKTDENP